MGIKFKHERTHSSTFVAEVEGDEAEEDKEEEEAEEEAAAEEEEEEEAGEEEEAEVALSWAL